MLGYLIYDEKDVHRGTNYNFISWFIEEANTHGLTLKLVTQHTLPEETPDFVINRSRFHELSLKYNCKHFNSAKVTEIANDKWLTYENFKNIVPMMKTTLASNNKKYPCIYKSRHGHGGTEVYHSSINRDFDDGYIAQEIATPGKDLRVYILNNEVYASIMRTNNQDFKSNYTLGGHGAIHTLTHYEHQIIEKVLDILPITYGGIDLLYHKGQPVLNEIEDPVGAKMLYNLTDLNIVKDYFKIIKNKLRRK